MKTFAIDTKSASVPNFLFSGTNIQAPRASRAIKRAEKLFPGKHIRARLLTTSFLSNGK